MDAGGRESGWGGAGRAEEGGTVGGVMYQKHMFLQDIQSMWTESLED